MAERTSTRAGSRRTTPQPAPQIARVGTQSPPNRTTRITRSQSRDVSDSEDGRTSSKGQRGAKQATPAGTHGAIGQSTLKGRKGRSANYAKIQQDLSVVAEDPTVVYPELESAEDGGIGENVGDAGAGQRHTEQNYKSPAGFSAFSGTTARISLPAQDPTDLSSEDMLDTLPDLLEASEKLLSFVIPAQVSEASTIRTMAELQSSDTRAHKKFKRLDDTFERQRKEYGGDSYIDVAETLRKLLGKNPGPIDEQTATWRPDALLQKANLAILMSRMLSIAEQNVNNQFLEDLAGTFPRPFAQRLGLPESLTPECSALAEATFQLALEVRTQEAIMLLARHVRKINFDPDAALVQVFFHDANTLKGWTVSGLRMADLEREAKDAILERVEQLREAFSMNVKTSSDGQSFGIESLRVRYPWAGFAQQMITWAGQRLTEIEIQTMTYGGVQAICQGLVDVIQSGSLGHSSERGDVDNESDSPERLSEVRLDYDTPSESRATSEQQDALNGQSLIKEFNLQQFSTDSSKLRIAAAHLRQRQAEGKVTNATEQISLTQNQNLASDVQVKSTAGPSLRALTPQQTLDGHNVRSPAGAIFQSGQAPSEDQDDSLGPGVVEDEDEDIGRARRLNAKKMLAFRKKKEAESNKENIAEIPESQLNKTAEQRPIYDRAPLGTRVSPIEDSEISSDEGFQRQQPPTATVQRRVKPATKRPASEPVRLQRRSPKKVRLEENINARASDGSADVAPEEQQTDLPPSQAYEEYKRANKSAKERTAVVIKAPQKRSAWTIAETDMLFYLITEHGTSWKLLKAEDIKQGHVLEARDQVALKDKARNMKMDYLKAGRILPQNFERIALSHLQIKRLRDSGVEYDSETGTRVDAEVTD